MTTYEYVAFHKKFGTDEIWTSSDVDAGSFVREFKSLHPDEVLTPIRFTRWLGQRGYHIVQLVTYYEGTTPAGFTYWLERPSDRHCEHCEQAVSAMDGMEAVTG